jgi:hypothetical protein
MNPPIKMGERVVVHGNLQPYAKAIVVDLVFNKQEARWGIILEWPDAPGGPSVSRVWDHDEGKVWRRYADEVATAPN